MTRATQGLVLGAFTLSVGVTTAQPLPPPPPRPPGAGTPAPGPAPSTDEPPPPPVTTSPPAAPTAPPPTSTAPSPPPPRPAPPAPPSASIPQAPAAPVAPAMISPPRDPRRYRHDGFFMRGAVGYARVRSRGHYSTDDSGATDPYGYPYYPQGPTSSPLESVDGSGVTVELAMGGTLAPGLVVAGQLASHMFTNPTLAYGGTEQSELYASERGVKYTSLGLLLMLYPDDTRGFHGGLAAGLMNAYQEYGYSYDFSDRESSGWFLAPELGYEWWVSAQTSVGILGRVAFARVTGGPDYGPTTTDDYTAHVALPSLVLTLTYH